LQDGAPRMVRIELCGVGKTFENRQENRVLHGIDLEVPKGQVVAIRGDNGSGKTTLLNIIAGIWHPTEGSVRFEGLGGETLRVGFTQQDYTSSLLPWFDVLDNVAIPLRLRGLPARDRRVRADKVLDELGFNNVPRSGYPHQLSGGQRQRVAVARALIHEPHLLLLDEPFANLDAHTSRDVQEILLRIHEQSHPTILYVSHELDHCVYLADRVILLHGSPARIVEDFHVALERPRRREMLLSPAYVDIRSRILAAEEKLYARKR
jgi:NitT/TauT family transport system ATP-binding protein